MNKAAVIAVLKFYANPDNWVVEGVIKDSSVWKGGVCGGDKARKLLIELGELTDEDTDTVDLTNVLFIKADEKDSM